MDDGLAAFWAARLDDDEQFLRTVTEVGEREAAKASDTVLMGVAGAALSVLADPAVLRTLARQIETHVPAPTDVKRLLREIAAKRELLADYERAYDEYAEFDVTRMNHLRLAVKRFAAIYERHPDYNRGWAL